MLETNLIMTTFDNSDQITRFVIELKYQMNRFQYPVMNHRLILDTIAIGRYIRRLPVKIGNTGTIGPGYTFDRLPLVTGQITDA
jgi:hypothetical protein